MKVKLNDYVKVEDSLIEIYSEKEINEELLNYIRNTITIKN